MNLSSYLQMPPAPLVPTNTSNAAPQAARPGVGPSAGASLGFDFSQIMARQLERLVPIERQTLAADTTPSQEQPVQNQDSRQATSERNQPQDVERETRDAPQARASEDTSQEEADATAARTVKAREKTTAAKSSTNDIDSLLAGLMQGAPTVPVDKSAEGQTPAAPLATATESLAVVTPTSEATDAVRVPTNLQTIELSPQVRIITDPKKAPSPESLAAFAKSMGLDESAIQNLLGQPPVTPTSATTTPATTLTNGLASASTLALATPTPLQATPNVATQSDSAVATQLVAMNVVADTPAVISGAGLSAPAATLLAPTQPGLTATDMAAIQQLNITVLPAAVLPVVGLPVNTAATSAPVPSTLEMLSLFDSGVQEPDVSALLSRFSEEAGNDNAPGQQSSQGDSPTFSSFAQALANNKNSANAAPANAAQATAAHMSEVYDQLSDKMATELAARMHKQLSDGEWKMKFALRPSNLGGVEIQLEMKDGKLDAVFRADNPLTRDLLQNSSQRLREALGNFGINAGQVNIGQGSGNAQQNNSGNFSKRSQVRDNSSSQVNGTEDTSSVTSTRSKANASLLDLYA